jgi:hypothetical protein
MDNLTIIRKTIQGMMHMQESLESSTRDLLLKIADYKVWLVEHGYIEEEAFFILLGGIISGKYIELDRSR